MYNLTHKLFVINRQIKRLNIISANIKKSRHKRFFSFFKQNQVYRLYTKKDWNLILYT